MNFKSRLIPICRLIKCSLRRVGAHLALNSTAAAAPCIVLHRPIRKVQGDSLSTIAGAGEGAIESEAAGTAPTATCNFSACQ